MGRYVTIESILDGSVVNNSLFVDRLTELFFVKRVKRACDLQTMLISQDVIMRALADFDESKSEVINSEEFISDGLITKEAMAY